MLSRGFFISYLSNPITIYLSLSQPHTERFRPIQTIDILNIISINAAGFSRERRRQSEVCYRTESYYLSVLFSKVKCGCRLNETIHMKQTSLHRKR